MSTKRPTPAKITRPTIEDVYTRERLMEHLDRYRDRIVTWISAPAGSGKTTLVADYLDRRRLACLWYELSRQDEDIASFFYYMGLGVKKAAPRQRKPLPLLTPEYLADVATYSMRFFESLSHRLKWPYAVVLDNYQEISEQSGLHEVLLEGLRGLSRHIRVIVVSRKEPPGWMARMQANREVGVLEADDLRFTLEEMKEVARLQHKEPVAEKQVEQLHKLTHGWIAGLILLLQRKDLGELSWDKMGEHGLDEVFAYFASQVFDKLDEKIKTLLLKTAYLPSVGLHEARELTGDGQVDRILSRLNRENCFTEKRYAEKVLYQYHPLFRDFLKLRAEESYGKEELYRIKQMSADLMERAGQAENAANMYCLLGESERLIKLIKEKGPELISQGRIRTLEQWFGCIHPQTVRFDPWLLYLRGCNQKLTSPAAARIDFETAYQKFKEEGDPKGLYLAWLGVVESFVVAREHLSLFKDWADEMGYIVENYPQIPSDEISNQVIANMVYALTICDPTNPSYPYWDSLAKDMPYRTMDPSQQLVLNGILMQIYCFTGMQTRARLIFDAINQTARFDQASDFAKIVWFTIASLYWYTQGAFEKGQESAQRALDVSCKTGVRVWEAYSLMYFIYNVLARGDLESADEKLGFMGRIIEKGHQFDLCSYYHIIAFRSLLVGDFQAALSYLNSFLQISGRFGSPFGHGFSVLLSSYIHFKCGNLEEAQKYHAQAKQDCRLEKSKMLYYKYLLLETGFALAQADAPKILTTLSDALRYGKTNLLRIIDFWAPSDISALCAAALEHGIEVDYVKDLIRVHNLTPHPSFVRFEHWPWKIKVATLGGFTLMVDGQAQKVSGKAQKKPLELLKAVIAHGAGGVGIQMISDVLWPDADGDMAKRSFATTLHRLRRLLGSDSAVILGEGKVSLNGSLFWVDVWAFDWFLKQAGSELGDEDLVVVKQGLQKPIELYKGAFLGGDAEEEWIFSARQRYRSKYFRVVTRLGRVYEKSNQIERAVECFQKGIEVDPLAEELYQELMLCLQRSGRRVEAVGVYESCKQAFSSIAGLDPSEKTQSIYQSLLGSS